MKAKQVYENAMALLGYAETPQFQRRAIPIINQAMFDLFGVMPVGTKFKPITTLSEEITMPDNVVQGVLPLGVAEKLALAEGDGELQQYFAMAYDNAKKRLNTTRTIIDTMP